MLNRRRRPMWSMERLESRDLLTGITIVDAAPNKSFIGQALSADGRTVVGVYTDENYSMQPARWNRDSSLEVIDSANIVGEALAVSGNGSRSLVRTYVSSFFPPTTIQDRVWQGNRLLEVKSPDYDILTLDALSASGTIFGTFDDKFSLSPAGRPFRASSENGPLEPLLPDGGTFEIRAVSDDGNVVIGTRGIGFFGWTRDVVKWSNGSVIPLPRAANVYSSQVGAVSGDGMTVVGSAILHKDNTVIPGLQPSVPVIWTANGEQPLPGMKEGIVVDTTYDGSVLVGNGVHTTGGSGGFVWTADQGTQPIMGYLESHGVSTDKLRGLDKFYVFGVSADGKVLAGSAESPGSRTITWIADSGAFWGTFCSTPSIARCI